MNIDFIVILLTENIVGKICLDASEAVSEGKSIGRNLGARNAKLNTICVSNHNYIIHELNSGKSIPSIAKKIKIAKGTLYRYLAYTEIRLPSNCKNGRWNRGIY